MSRRRASHALLTATAVGALALTACGGSADAETAVPQAAPEAGGELTVALDRELPTLDVANNLIGQQPIRLLANALYQPLMDPAAGGAFVPGLAESLISDDTATAWTLTIPEGITFSDGSALTTTEIQAHIERLSDPETGSSFAGQAAQIASMEPTSETTMVFTLAAPNADFASVLARGLGMITSSESIDEFGFPLGAGAYVVEDFVAGDSVTLVRNENYWGEPGTLETITFEMMPDADSRFQSLQAGDVDLIWTEVTSQFQQARTDDALAVHAAPAAVSSLVLNLAHEKFQDPRVRTALAQAIDRDAINAVVNLGEGVPIDSPYALLGDLAPEIDYPSYDEDAAAAVLADLDLGFSLTVENRPDTIQRATALKDMLGRVGVDVEISPVESADFGATLLAREYEAADFVTSIFSDPSGGSLVSLSSGGYNFSGYSSDVVDTELAAASGLTDTADRAEHLAAVSAELAVDLPILWLTASNAGFIGSADLVGIPDISDLTLISVDPSRIGWAAE